MTLMIGTDADTNEAVELKHDDLTLGTAIIGKTGAGKSTLLTHMIQENVHQIGSNKDQENGWCTFVFDPHGDLCRTVIHTTPRKFIDNLVLIDIDPSVPFHLNPFSFANPAEILAVDNNATNFVTLFKKILGMNERQILVDRVLQNIATVLIENQGHTLLDVPKLLQNIPFRKQLLQNVTNSAVIRYWQEDYEHTFADPRARSEEINPVLRRIGMLTEQNFLYRIFSQPEPTIKFAELLNTRKVYLINLSQLSESNIELLGTILLFQLACSIYARAEATKRPRVELFIDEYGKFALSDITANLLLQGRKFACATTCAIQVLASLPDEKNKGAFFQAGNIISFRAIGEDAAEIAENFDTTPPPVIPRKVAVPSNVFDRLLSSNTSHPNPDVRQLVTELLEPLVKIIEWEHVKPYMNATFMLEEATSQKHYLNGLLREVLERTLIPEKDRLQFRIQLQQRPRKFGFLYPAFFKHGRAGIYRGPEAVLNAVHHLCLLLAEEENRQPLLVPAEYIDESQRQQTYADREKQIANDLVMLPKYMMRCQFTTDAGITQCTVRLKDKLPWLGQISEEAVRASGQTRFGKPWQPGHPGATQTEHGTKPSPEPPERKTWEEE